MLFFKQSNYTCGFTLIELMLALLIFSLLSMVALPSFSSWLESAQAKTTRQLIYGLLSEARNQALIQSETITLCRLDSDICMDDFGFPISSFVDINRNGRLDPNEKIIRYLDVDLPENIQLVWNRGGFLRFWPSGGVGSLTGSLSYCDQFRNQNDFRLVIARTGRVRIDLDETKCPSAI